jgi:glutamate-1-semialdehyde 2,1-aminomutase
MKFTQSNIQNEKLHQIIPGGAHTYAKGTDQFPEGMAPVIDRGQGSHVWDIDNNEFIEYGMGLRAVTLGHAYKPVVEAAYKQSLRGNNFVRPAAIEAEAVEELLDILPFADMIKFGKNGSDTTSAAIKLARAYTGRQFIAVCGDHPFFSVDDWFISTTPMSAGIPEVLHELIKKFRYNDLVSLEKLFDEFPDKIACIIMEPEKNDPPENEFLQNAREICHKNGALFIFDEMITGFRWDIGGGQRYHNVVPDLSTFGKALGNGYSVSALAGKKEIMQLGGYDHPRERVFTLSLTHGAETPCLAASIATLRVYKTENVIETLWGLGSKLREKIQKSINDHKLQDYVKLFGRDCCLVYGTAGPDKKPSQGYRTLFLQEIIKRGILAPSLVVSYSHTDADVDKTCAVIDDALIVYKKALDEGLERYLKGRPVKPVFRKYK